MPPQRFIQEQKFLFSLDILQNMDIAMNKKKYEEIMHRTKIFKFEFWICDVFLRNAHCPLEHKWKRRKKKLNEK